MKLRMTTLVAMAAAGSMLAGCGGGESDDGQSAAATPAASDAASFDPCSLLSADEVAAITTDAVIGMNRDGATCTYQSKPEALKLTVMRTGGTEQMAVARRTADVLGGMGASVADKGGAGADAADLLRKDSSTAPSLGDEAMWGLNGTLSVRQGDAFVEVTPPMMHDPAHHPGYPLVSPAEKRSIAEAVARKTLTKLR